MDISNVDVFHAYNRLVEENKVKPLTCPDCETRLVTRAQSDKLYLYCCGCDSSFWPGLDLFSRVKAVVREHEISY